MAAKLIFNCSTSSGLWTGAGTGVPNSGDPIYQITNTGTDTAGCAFARQSVSGRRLTWTSTGGPNNLGYVTGTGGCDMDLGTAVRWPSGNLNNFTLHVVARVRGDSCFAGFNNPVGIGSAGSERMLWGNPASTTWVATADCPNAPTGWAVYTYVRNGTTMSFFQNGVKVGNDVTESVGATYFGSIFARNAGGSYSYQLRGDVAYISIDDSASAAGSAGVNSPGTVATDAAALMTTFAIGTTYAATVGADAANIASDRWRALRYGLYLTGTVTGGTLAVDITSNYSGQSVVQRTSAIAYNADATAVTAGIQSTQPGANSTVTGSGTFGAPFVIAIADTKVTGVSVTSALTGSGATAVIYDYNASSNAWSMDAAVNAIGSSFEMDVVGETLFVYRRDNSSPSFQYKVGSGPWTNITDSDGLFHWVPITLGAHGAYTVQLRVRGGGTAILPNAKAFRVQSVTSAASITKPSRWADQIRVADTNPGTWFRLEGMVGADKYYTTDNATFTAGVATPGALSALRSLNATDSDRGPRITITTAATKIGLKYRMDGYARVCILDITKCPGKLPDIYTNNTTTASDSFFDVEWIDVSQDGKEHTYVICPGSIAGSYHWTITTIIANAAINRTIVHPTRPGADQIGDSIAGFTTMDSMGQHYLTLINEYLGLSGRTRNVGSTTTRDWAWGRYAGNIYFNAYAKGTKLGSDKQPEVIWVSLGYNDGNITSPTMTYAELTDALKSLVYSIRQMLGAAPHIIFLGFLQYSSNSNLTPRRYVFDAVTALRNAGDTRVYMLGSWDAGNTTWTGYDTVRFAATSQSVTGYVGSDNVHPSPTGDLVLAQDALAFLPSAIKTIGTITTGGNMAREDLSAGNAVSVTLGGGVSALATLTPSGGTKGGCLGLKITLGGSLTKANCQLDLYADGNTSTPIVPNIPLRGASSPFNAYANIPINAKSLIPKLKTTDATGGNAQVTEAWI